MRLDCAIPQRPLGTSAIAALDSSTDHQSVRAKFNCVARQAASSSNSSTYSAIARHDVRPDDYDASSRPVYSDSDVMTWSVYRFKGQSAPAVVLAEIDFETLDDTAIRKLFVGATRATMKLVLVFVESGESAALPSAAELISLMRGA